MRTMLRTLLGLGLVALLASPAVAQGRGFGRFGGSLTFLLTNESVQKELKLDDKQIEKAKELADKTGEEMRDKFANDKTSLKELRRFVEEAQWDITDTKATGQVKDVKDRVYMRKLEGRWFLETRKQGAAAKEK